MRALSRTARRLIPHLTLAATMLSAGIAQAGEPPARGLMPEIAHTVISPAQACQTAIAGAERSHRVPAGFLLAIGRVESGRPDRRGVVQPWPWTIDVAGHGYFFESRADAIAAVLAAQASGTRSIDIGCMQVNLQQHPTAFETLDDAFDPVSNADYAARFLIDLHRETGDWSTASGLYHSRNEALAMPYREAVATRFVSMGGSPLIAAPAPALPLPQPHEALAAAWAATVDHADGPLRLWPKPPPPPPVTPVNRVRDWRLTSRY